MIHESFIQITTPNFVAQPNSTSECAIGHVGHILLLGIYTYMVDYTHGKDLGMIMSMGSRLCELVASYHKTYEQSF